MACGLWAAPRRSTSMYPPSAVTGVRSSCEASAMNRRTRLSDSTWAANASSIRSAMWSKAPASCPTSSPRGNQAAPGPQVAAGELTGGVGQAAEGSEGGAGQQQPEDEHQQQERTASDRQLIDVAGEHAVDGVIGSETSTTAVARLNVRSVTPTVKPATRSEPTI